MYSKDASNTVMLPARHLISLRSRVEIFKKKKRAALRLHLLFLIKKFSAKLNKKSWPKLKNKQGVIARTERNLLVFLKMELNNMGPGYSGKIANSPPLPLVSSILGLDESDKTKTVGRLVTV